MLKKGQGIACKTPIDVFVYESGVNLREGGQLEQATLCFDERHPPILDNDCCLTRLLEWWFHERTLHSGIRV